MLYVENLVHCVTIVTINVNSRDGSIGGKGGSAGGGSVGSGGGDGCGGDDGDAAVAADSSQWDLCRAWHK